ncbi:MAG: FAD-dependent oxidoreductase [bacterium]|nr:FAD-dependent oxidoreductase [bacterium]
MGSRRDLLLDRPGRSALLLGNDAIVRGAIEAGVGFACGYPGTPSTEVTDGFAELAPALGIPFEYSVNEKIALEMAFAASLAGARSIVAMKHLGLMYAGDPLSTIPYIGVEGGLVIVSAGDPSCLTSPNEQDQRHLADMLHVPLLDPRTPQDALDVTRFAFELSERSRLPVLVRPTTRVCHTMAPVRFGPIGARRQTGFVRSPGRYIPMPANARRFRREIIERLATARELIEESALFSCSGSRSTAVLASGAPAATCADTLAELGAENEIALFQLSTIYPLPEEWLLSSLREVETLLVVEELSPYLEDRLRALLALHGLGTRVLGKRTGHLPEQGEYDPEVIRRAFHEALQVGEPPALTGDHQPPAERPPSLCPSCPHRSAFFAARTVFGDDALYFNDIGCYTLGTAPPLKAGDALLCMGAGFTLAAGVARMTGKQTLGFLGDSTFFHSGMPALLNVIKSDVDMVAVIMDNGITAMTGFQESPAAKIIDGRSEHLGNIEGTVRALGAKHVEAVDPNDLEAACRAFERARDRRGLSVIITQRVCPVFEVRSHLRTDGAKPAAKVGTFEVDHASCGHCGRSSHGLRCAQSSAEDFERQIVRMRSLESDREQARPAVAPCAEKCPLYLCVQGYAAHIASGRYAEALELIMDALALPDSVCRVCDKPCESVCERGTVDQPIAINDLKKFVLQWARECDEPAYRPELEPGNGKSVAIVGAGPAGLAAAYELRLRGYEVRVFDANEAPGGMLLTGIPAYRLPREALQRDVARILDHGVHFEGGRRLGGDLQLETLLEEHGAVLLAMGGGRGVELPLAGEGPRVLDALDYLSAQPDSSSAGQGSGERVVVIGGGNSAIDASRSALRRGAKKVVIVSLEDREHMPAIPEEILEAEREGVVIRAGWKATDLIEEGVRHVRVQPAESSRAVAGRLHPDAYEAIPGTQEILGAELLIVAIGQRLDDSVLGGLGIDLECEGGLVRVDTETHLTSHPRVFAAGDLTARDRTVTGAIAAGRRAAWGIDRTLRGNELADRRPPPPIPPPFVTRNENKRWRSHQEERRHPPELDPAARTGSFDEVVGTFDEEGARAEANRCLFCGQCGNCRSCLDLFGCPAFLLDGDRVEIDPDLCVGCDVCAQFCPNGALAAAPALSSIGSLP